MPASPFRSSFAGQARLFLRCCALGGWLSLAGFARAQSWNLSWSDEFNGAAGSAIDATKWQFEYGDLKVNDELEWYCGPPGDPRNQQPCGSNPGNASNAYIDGNGHLVIQAFRITSATAPGSKAWTSTRMNTANHPASFQYGRIEASVKLPVGPGIWPAFWALGTNIDAVDWPNSGEIDFMEDVPASGGLGPSIVKSTIHGPTYSGGNGIGQDFKFPLKGATGPDVTSFHTYGAIWSPSMLQFYVDDPANVFFVRTASDVPGGASQWAFNHPFFLILNLAIGGANSWPGPPDATTPSPALMLVDYVRVYTPAAIAAPTMTATPIHLATDGSASGMVTLTAPGETGGRHTSGGGGIVYLECTGAPAGASCTIDSGNPLSSAVVDLRHTNSGRATIRLARQDASGAALPSSGAPLPSSSASAVESYQLTVTAHTVSGDSSTVRVRVSSGNRP